MVKNPSVNAGDARDTGSIPGSGRSPGGGNGTPLQSSSLGESREQRSLVGYSPCSHKEPDTAAATDHARTHVYTYMYQYI